MQQIARSVALAFNNLPRPHRVMLGSLTVLTLAVAVWRPYVYHRDFSSTAEMYGWIQQILSSPDVTKAECANSDSFHGTFGDGMDVVHP